MTRLLLTAVLCVAAAAAGYLYGARPSSAKTTGHAAVPAAAVEPLAPLGAPPAPTLSASEVQARRDNGYRDLDSLDDVLTLPGDFSQTEALYILAGRADLATLQRYLREAAAIPERGDRGAALQILLGRYVEIDPGDALAHLLGMRLDIEDNLLRVLFTDWARRDVNAAVAAVNAIAEPALRRTAGAAILGATSQIDAGMLDVVAERLTDHHDLDVYRAQAIAALASHSPRLALDQALALSNHNARWQALQSLGQTWGQAAPQDAFAAAQQLATREQRRALLRSAGWAWAHKDPQALLSAIPQINDRDAAAELTRFALEQLVKRDPQAALSAVESLGGNHMASNKAMVLGQWALNDPDAATTAALSVSSPREREQLLQNIARNVAQSDPQQAMLWLEQFPAQDQDRLRDAMMHNIALSDPDEALAMAVRQSGPQRSAMLSQVIGVIARSDPFRAASLLDEVPAHEARYSLAMAIASEIAQQQQPLRALAWLETLDPVAFNGASRPLSRTLLQTDPQAAIDFADRLNGEQRMSWVRAVAGGLARSDPERALSLAQSTAGTPIFVATMNEVLPHIAESDPQRALALTERLPEEERDMLAMSVIGRLAQSQPEAAARWIERQPPGTRRDKMASSLMGFGQFSQRDALAIIRGIEDPTAREGAIAAAYLSLLRRAGDRQAATALLNRVELSQQQRARLEQLASGYGGY